MKPEVVEKGQSFKSLKKMAKNKKAKAGGDPDHESYRFCIKSTAIDVDSIDLTDDLTKKVKHLLVVGEND